MRKYFIFGIALGILFLAIIGNVFLIYRELNNFFSYLVSEETARVKTIVESTLAAGGDPIEAITSYMQHSPFLKGATFSLAGREIIIPGSEISNSYFHESFKASMFTFTLYFDFSSLHLINKRIAYLIVSLLLFAGLFSFSLFMLVRAHFKERIKREREERERERLESINLVIHSLLHEVKNRLNTLRLITYKLKSNFDKELLNTLEFELERLGQYIEETAELRRPISLNLSRVSIKELVTDVVQKFEEIFNSKGISVEVSVEDFKLTIDKEKIASVIVDLVKNAVEAVEDKDSPQIKIIGKKVKNKYYLAVKDNAGKLADVQLFKPFVSTKKKGLGLGLFNAKRIIEAHKGYINARKEDGWTVFEFEIPINPEQTL
ncbi:MAG: GHKL domain-containing protein, partial [Thermodesulfobacteria bacterium]|nr:GHKL domain-containing protein [Thermodesulfobacteriota bacterium]